MKIAMLFHFGKIDLEGFGFGTPCGSLLSGLTRMLEGSKGYSSSAPPSESDQSFAQKYMIKDTALVPITSSCASRWHPLEYADAAISTLSVSSGQPVIDDMNARNSFEYKESRRARRWGNFAASSGWLERFMFARSCVWYNLNRSVSLYFTFKFVNISSRTPSNFNSSQNGVNVTCGYGSAFAYSSL